jgi:dihydrodipicolinate synthase/N-acetylneuraminate lyase
MAEQHQPSASLDNDLSASVQTLSQACAAVRARLREGLAIPAHPLALDVQRKLDERHQRALTRYYLAAGCGGLAVGVHTTQFDIRKPEHGLYGPVLELAAETARAHHPQPLLIAGVIGPTHQAISEALLARDLGYQAVLLSLGGLDSWSDARLLDHCRCISEIMPVMGFYLQPTVGGRELNYRFWRQFVEIENIVGIKVAPFNRYQTLDVVRAVAESGRADSILLYTGNDDMIVFDLLAPYRFGQAAGHTAEDDFEHAMQVTFVGGLLGHWAVWTRSAVRLLEEIRSIVNAGGPIPLNLVVQANQITDCNSAFFDTANNYRGCIAGIHEVLRRQGLMANNYCLDPNETLSPGQVEEIDRVYEAYPHLNDDAFVAEHLAEWLS